MGVFYNKDQWGLILGASSGIGLATAKKLALEGMNLIIVYRERRARQKEIDQLWAGLKKNKIKLIDFNLDALSEIKRKEVILKIKEKVGQNKIRLFMHSIAKGNLKLMTSLPKSNGMQYPPNHLTSSDFSFTSETMSYSLVTWLNDLIENKLLDDPSRVIAMSSSGDKRVWKGYAAVASAKASLDAIIKYIAVEYSHLGVSANIIEAGVTVTPSMKLIPGSDEIIKKVQERHPRNRLTLPEDIANVVYLICREEASWINGSRIVVDGGESLV